ncbi:hypothetical protein AAFO92_03785 [Roseovarius sp. CAU 1744]|uniref:hypothetical protein n=1 Tax=Roseovarius sp. CAU 1744 TaxID=3140368 RepID=UPI00325BDD1A
MTPKYWIALALLTGSLAITGCAPAVVGAAAVGAAGVVMTDKAIEEEKGGDGVF